MLRRSLFLLVLSALTLTAVGRGVSLAAPPPAASPSPATDPYNRGGAHVLLPPRQPGSAPSGAAGLPGFASSVKNNMTYHGGPVMHSSETFLVFWLPSGQHFEPNGSGKTDADYENLIKQYFQDLGGSDFYGLMTQYSDTNGAITNSSTYRDMVVDTTAFPHPGANNDTGTYANPLFDDDLAGEIQSLITGKGAAWAPSNTREYFIYTPLDVVTCGSTHASNDRTSCSSGPNVPANDFQYCAYHWSFPHNNPTFLYSIMPDPRSGSDGCVFYNGSTDGTTVTYAALAPNNDLAADQVISITTHELFETVTDPFGNGWKDNNNAGEIGDKCQYPFFWNTQFGPVGADQGNLTLNGHRYFAETQWSNAVTDCGLNATTSYYTTTVGASVKTAALSVQVTVTATANIGPAIDGKKNPLFYILVVDTTNNNAVVSSCGWPALTCTASVTSLTALTHQYIAQVAYQDGTVVQTTSAPVDVTWGAAQAGDVNLDNHVTAVDALCVLRTVAQLGATVPCPTPLPGNAVLALSEVASHATVPTAVDALCILRGVALLLASTNCPLIVGS